MKRVLISGANRGIGLELVRQCLARGDRVFAGCREPEEAAELKKLVAAAPDRLTILALDVTAEATIDTAAERVEALMDTSESGIWHFASTRCTGRVELAHAICKAKQLSPEFVIQPISELPSPHLGKVELLSEKNHPLAQPLPSLLDRLALAD